MLKKIFFTKPGLHQNCHELENQLISRIKMAREKADKVIVVYGGKFCYVNVDAPTRTMQKLLEEQGPGIGRVQGHPLHGHACRRDDPGKNCSGNGRRRKSLVDDARLAGIPLPGLRRVG